MRKIFIFMVVFNSLLINYAMSKDEYTIESPDKNIQVKISIDKGLPFYSVFYKGKEVLLNSKLGLIRNDGDFSKAMKIKKAGNPEKASDAYVLMTDKRKECKYEANKRVFTLANAKSQEIQIIFQVSNDGVAFCYRFEGKSTDVKKISVETTSFHFPADAKAWLHPHRDAQTGWCKSQPSYEENYEQGIAVGTASPDKAGWSFPALFNSRDCWFLITETGLEPTYCGSRLGQNSPNGEYSIAFAQDGERISPDAAYLPESVLPWQSPWRLLILGTLSNIVESTLVTDLAIPSKVKNTEFVKPGRSSWSWVLLKDDATVFDVQVYFIDLAAKMGWKYCLVDADWNKKIGYEKIQELINYAKGKNVDLLLWYNSAGTWNTTEYQPRDMMFVPEIRRKEMEKISKMGVKGIKVDFWGGDGQSMVKYYYDLFTDAANYGLMVNCHGATIPRGWNRTFPNLVTMEAVKGMEFITFEQKNADAGPSHCAMLPFTRNVVGPMDFTPMCLTSIPNIKRKTGNGFELALPVLFVSGIQHYAETPVGIAIQPDYIKDFLKQIPDSWDDVKFIDGFPGKYVVIARKAGKKWFVAGINGTDEKKSFDINLSSITTANSALLIGDEENAKGLFHEKVSLQNGIYKFVAKPRGGFVMIVE